MSGPIINTIFLDSPIGGDRNSQFQFLRSGISTAFLRIVTHATFLMVGNWVLWAQNWGGLRFFVPSMTTSEKRVIYD